MTTKPFPSLTREQVDEIGRELDAIRDEQVADLGEQDAAHIRGVVRLARGSAIAGRTLLAFGFGPASFGAGVAALAAAKILENMEIGHNVLHGQYDWMNDPGLDSRSYEWDHSCDAAQWRHSHNHEHHTHTNILGLDRDVGYGLIRVAEEQRWSWKHLIQPLTNALLCAGFEWGVALHDLDTGRVLLGGGDEEELATKRREFPGKAAALATKAARQLFKDYVLFPLLTPWNAPRVFAGNLAANAARNVWTNVIIFCGHFPEGTRTYTREEAAGESRGDWYIRQMQGSANIEGAPWFHVATGHLSHQVEHHLFPDIPAWRYPRIAPRVQALCEKHGLPYNTGSFASQYASVLAKVWRLAVPPALVPG